MIYSNERVKFSNQQVYWYFYIVEWGKTGPAYSFPPPKFFDLSIDRLVFWFMLLFHCILTLMNDLFQRENQVFNPKSLFVLLHWGVWKDWAGPFFPPSKMFLSFYLSFSPLDYAVLSWLLNTYEWTSPKRGWNVQSKQLISTSTFKGGERLGRPILSTLQNVLIFLFIFQSFGLCYSFTVS